MRIRGLFVFVMFALVSVLPAASLAKKKCSADADCTKKDRVCHQGSCTKVSDDESLLRVRLANPISVSASLFIDDDYMGTVPWDGMVSAGFHRIKVDAYGYLPATFKGQSRGGKVDTLTVEMKVAPPPAAPENKQQYQEPIVAQEPSGERAVPGTLVFAIYGGGGYGTASWGSEGRRRPNTIVQGGGAFGLRVVTDPVWLDLALALSSSSYMIKNVADWGEIIKLNFGLLARLMFPVKDNLFYLGAELEPGYGLSSWRYGYIQAHFAISIFPTHFLELRLNPIGVEYLQHLEFNGYMASFHATAGIAIRFPKKPLF